MDICCMTVPCYRRRALDDVVVVAGEGGVTVVLWSILLT
jgi:hypothetical protein